MATEFNVESLLGELTLSEKISLLAGADFWHTVPIERLDIPQIRVSDGPNGIRGTKFFNGVPSNCFPCGTAMAASFNKDLWTEAGILMAKEAKMKGAHVILGPTCNIVRSPLGGRGFESFSEDPLLSGHAASHIIKGIQSQSILACIKHYVCNDQEDERKAVDAFVSERALREIYLKPFQIALRDSDPRSLMTAYNKVNGTHASQSKYLLQDILRDEWKYSGAVMSDWFGTYSIKESLDAGMNLEMPGPARFRELTITSHKVNCNEIDRNVIDHNVRHVLNFIKEARGARIPKDIVESPNTSPEASNIMRKIGDESIVLLKNEDNILPLSKIAIKGQTKIAMIGPNVKASQDSGGGSASMNTRYKISPYEGMVKKLEEGGNNVILKYALGASLDKNLPDVGSLCKNNAGREGITAKFYKDAPGAINRHQFDEIDLNSSKIFLSDYKNNALDPSQSLYFVDFECTYVPEESGIFEFGCSCLGTAQIFVDDKLIVDNKTKQVAGVDFFLGMGTREERSELELKKGIFYKIRVEFGTSPTYTLENIHKEAGGVNFGFSIKFSPEREIEKAVELAKEVDRVIIVVGLSKEWESEGFDRPDMNIPGYTDKLIKEICLINENVIVVNQSGTPVTMPWAEKVKGLIQAWYGGNELGNAIADVLVGDHNPSGKLSMSFPKRLEHNPSFLNFGSTNGQVLYGENIFVGYRYYELADREVLFPFGYGLSYTTFQFKDLDVKIDETKVYVTLKVVNTGRLNGAEVIQVYIRQLNPSVKRPFKELKDFEKVSLKSGEEKIAQLSFSLREATSYWDTYEKKWLSEKDTYSVLIGNSSDNILLEGQFSTNSSLLWEGL
ncbi:uncharacterized protein PRCAT00003473001 [Priceomyces carsonii]|uniref:uncharacterized protein n=1 Tax=Priceomyces carsonii TaxID=28549 RepID=UPI002EDA60B9|nr:unnamed protein product [Priceomyces carsonii]